MKNLSSAYRFRASANSGFTLTELAIVLGIISLVLGAVWVAAASMSSSNRLQTAEQEAALIVANYRALFAGRGVDIADAAPVGTDITCNNAAVNGMNDKFFPASMGGAACASGNTATYPTNPWNGYAQVLSNKANQGVVVVFGNIPQDACVRYVSGIPNTPDIIQVVINASAAITVLPISPAVASGVGRCAAGSANIVQVTYKAR